MKVPMGHCLTASWGGLFFCVGGEVTELPNYYIFIDESGNYDFSPKGTKYWVLTSLITEDLHPGLLEFYDLKHELIDLGTDIEYFHAPEDRQAVRDKVFNIIQRLSNLRVDSLIVDKTKVAPGIRPLHRFYPLMVENLLRYPLDPRGIDIQSYEKVFIFFDRAVSARNQQQALVAAVKQYLARHLKGVNYHITMHSSASHHYLQMVDYLSRAIYVKWERNETRPYSQIYHHIKSEFPIFENGSIAYY